MQEDIRHITQKNINRKKYDACIENAINSRAYALSWYLDVTTSSWDVLVYQDYKAVMPVPFLRSLRFLLVKQVIQPPFCQQLGVFYEEELGPKLMTAFYKALLNFNPKSYSFNSQNTLFFQSKISELQPKKNFELVLNKPYKELYNSFSTNTKRNLKKALKQAFSITTSCSIEDLIRLKKTNKKHQLNKNVYEKMRQLSSEIITHNSGEFVGVLYQNELVAIHLYIKTKQRIILLLTASNDYGKQHGASVFLNNHLIEKQANTELILDFEGSMIPGIARFFKSFGAKNIPYLLYKS